MDRSSSISIETLYFFRVGAELLHKFSQCDCGLVSPIHAEQPPPKVPTNPLAPASPVYKDVRRSRIKPSSISASETFWSLKSIKDSGKVQSSAPLLSLFIEEVGKNSLRRGFTDRNHERVTNRKPPPTCKHSANYD